ncbi:hypothetical protein HMPREF9140_01562 [Prevotella micans F0438]|uniref:Uncharacterized protein n=1 Tax=Prevotella micans F0438 TaxID=883158 RepID=H1Q3S4_9BACT|nr:hypothetical protein HMPREF9140_01562 [Prevotella micans F0438]
MLLANIIHNGFNAAEPPQDPNQTVSSPRDFRKAQTKRFHRRGTSARLKPNGFNAAEPPQGSNQTVSMPRDFRKAQTKRFHRRGTSARLKPNGFIAAELPQASNKIITQTPKPSTRRSYIKTNTRR